MTTKASAMLIRRQRHKSKYKMDMEGVLVRRMGLRKKEGEAAWRPIALLWARSNLMEDKGRLHTPFPP